MAVTLAASACGGDAADVTAGAGPSPSSGDGLALRIAGEVQGGLLCPGGRRPCLPVDGEIEEGSGWVWVSGRLTDEAFVVDDQRPLPRVERDYGNRCDDPDIDGPPSGEVAEMMYEGLSERPPGYVDLWDSDDGVLHLGVAGDTGPARAFLEDLGFADQICVVGGFPVADADLEAVQMAVSDAAIAAGYENFGSSRDSWAGTVSVDLPRVDGAFRAELEALGAEAGVVLTVVAGVEVIDGTLDDYDAAVAALDGGDEPASGLTARCGPVTFDSIPPDLDGFPSLDDDARAALDELVNGPTGVEAGGFDTDYEWSIALRTDDELVLFGQAADGHFADVRFDRRDGAWSPSGWGGCRILIDAPGLGPARVAVDPARPIDPADTELGLLINELACASGEAPTGREVVPVVVETATTVTVTALVAPVAGGAECPSNPWHPITITLDEPLGDRQLLDGQTSPAEPVGEPELF